MTKNQLAKEVFETAHLTGEFLLRSGTISHEYFDKYLFEAKPKLINEIAKQMTKLLPDEFDVIAGLEMGGIPIATLISQLTGQPLAMVRKKAKEYGTRKLAEGAEIKNKKVIVIEDVVTSAGQVITSSQELRQLGAVITDAFCVIDRQAGGKENLKKIGIQLHSLFSMEELKFVINSEQSEEK